MKKIILVISSCILLSGCDFLTPSQQIVSVSSEENISLNSETISSDEANSSEFVDSSSIEDSSSVTSESIVEENITLDFYNFNDFHGAIEETSSLGEPGISKISTYLKQEKAKNEDGFVLTSSGDMWQGSALSNTFKGAIVNDWMNYIGFDCMTLGNHEFDWGTDRIQTNMKEMNFPVISCNILDKDLAKPVDWIEGTAMKTIKGLNIGFVGAIGEGQTGDILASISHNLQFPDPSNYVINAATQLRENGADLIVYLLHDSNETVSTSVASKMDVIFCGHTHTGENKKISGKPSLQAYSNGKDMSHVKLTFNTKTKKVTYTAMDVVDLRKLSVSKDQETEDIINKRLTPEINAKLNANVGRTNRQLSQSDLSQLIVEYFYKYYKDNYHEFPIYATNYNNARSAISAGIVTYKDVFKSFPFENEAVVMKLKGSALKTITYGTFYYPGSTTLEDDKDYYVFTIDYIADYDYYYQPKLGVEIVRRYNDVYPRDIFARYFGEDYPL